jgi:hypothetical protein
MIKYKIYNFPTKDCSTLKACVALDKFTINMNNFLDNHEILDIKRLIKTTM